jgi:hypothetical protein
MREEGREATPALSVFFVFFEIFIKKLFFNTVFRVG